MHPDLKSVIETSKNARDQLIQKQLTVKEANAIATNNHNIVSAHALDLRTRIFDYETQKMEHGLIAADEKAGLAAAAGN